MNPSPDTASSAPSSAKRRQRRQRKWHHRVFTGCATCRRRHVKCDEQSPSCSNCHRLSLACEYDGANGEGRFLFRVTRPHSGPKDNSPPTHDSSLPLNTTVSDVAPPVARSYCQDPSPSIIGDAGEDHVDLELPDEENIQALQVERRCLTISSATPRGIITHETVYYTHFLTDVSTILIVYDTQSNANPYRMLPLLSDSSNLLQDTMVALGAMHLATLPATESKATHYRAAMQLYSTVVARLRDILAAGQSRLGLESLATSLLLCMFEKIYATDGTWKVHLEGARHILEGIYNPKSLASLPPESHIAEFPDGGLFRPMRRFLASAMAYLDVAAACATGEGTLISGDYWETLGGGWEYNLGAPSFYPSRTLADRELAQIRSAWSRIMSIQVGISNFSKLQAAGGADSTRKQLIHDDLKHRITNWHDSSPEIFSRLSQREAVDPEMPDGEAELLIAAACVQTYATACTIYLDRVATRELCRASQDSTIAEAVEKVISLALGFSSNLNRLAMLWSLFTAAAATTDEAQTTVFRDILCGLKNFGLKNISRALDTLEYVWLQQRIFGKADYDTFEQLVSTNLLP